MKSMKVPLTRIGEIVIEKKMELVTLEGEVQSLEEKGFDHFRVKQF